jgi:hypothetical protein
MLEPGGLLGMKAHQHMRDPSRWWHWAMLIVVTLTPFVVTLILASLAFPE